MDKSVEEIIEEWKTDLDPYTMNKYMIVSTSDVRELVKYFEDIDHFEDRIRR